MKKPILLVLVIVLIGLVACTPTAPGNTIKATGMTLKSEKQRNESPEVAPVDISSLTDGNGVFAFNLYKLVSQEEGNLFYSPCSISAALAMTYAGASEDTEKQMADTLQFYLSQNKLHTAFNSLDQELASRGEGAKGKDGEGFRLNIVNAIWGQKDYAFLVSFLDTLAEDYGAGIRILDFVNETEQSRITINDWVSDETEGRIKDLIPQGAISAMTRLVLTNAIYFNAAWQYPFEEDATSPGVFYLLDGDEVTVPMMEQQESFSYTEGDIYQVVELPYDGRELSMVILLPNSGQFEIFEEAIEYQHVKDIMENLERREVRLTMPKFEFDSSFGLKETLADMGMPISFSADADFSGMTGNKDLFISDVIHKAFVSVDEAGTEAAAATAVIMELTAMPEEPIEVTLDRPFIFLIRDIETGAILFIGRVMNPGA
ncbi:MAG: serpin family protein [Candidatus Methanospirareceae archaeon]